MPLKDWVIRVFGQDLYREMWEPLLRCKLGDMRSEASAAFLWSTIRRLYSTREKGVEKTEQLGYMEGGYRVVLDRLVEQIRQMGGRLYPGVRLEKIEATEDGIGISGQGAFREFDACLMTVPTPAILGMVSDLSDQYKARLSMPKYLGIVCVALVLRRSLSPYYLTNVTDDVPFTGIVEMTNLIDAAASASGRSLVYLPKYTSPSDPLFNLSDEEVWDRFAPALFRIHPTLKSSEIESMHIFRERFVQPVPTLNYSEQAPTINTGIPHLFVANSTQIVNDTLNNNAMTRIARNACSVVMKDLADQASARLARYSAFAALCHGGSDLTETIMHPFALMIHFVALLQDPAPAASSKFRGGFSAARHVGHCPSLLSALVRGLSGWVHLPNEEDADIGLTAQSDSSRIEVIPAYGAARQSVPEKARPLLSVDVEDYFQTEAFSKVAPRQDWDRYPLRVADNTRRIARHV